MFDNEAMLKLLSAYSLGMLCSQKQKWLESWHSWFRIDPEQVDLSASVCLWESPSLGELPKCLLL